MHPHLQQIMAWAAGGFVALVLASVLLAFAWRHMRRGWWTWLLLLCGVEAAYWLNVYAWLIEPESLVVQRVEFVSQRWSGAPLTIGVIADTHVGGPHVDAARVRRIVARLNHEHPDIVALLGDYADDGVKRESRPPAEREDIRQGIAAFGALQAPLGVFAVTGNHDAYYDWNAIAQALEEAGVAVLSNRNVIVDRPGGAFAMAGVQDVLTDRPAFAAALEGAEGRDTIVLGHSPDLFAAMPHGPALMLAGHSHCGQVTVPLLGRPITHLRNARYVCRFTFEEGKALYVTAGIGTTQLPVRFLNPPEIVLLTIRAAPR